LLAFGIQGLIALILSFYSALIVSFLKGPVQRVRSTIIFTRDGKSSILLTGSDVQSMTGVNAPTSMLEEELNLERRCFVDQRHNPDQYYLFLPSTYPLRYS
jgi:hypothetical protein